MKKEYHFPKLKEVKNPYPDKKKAVGINLSPEVLRSREVLGLRRQMLRRPDSNKANKE
jgi:hypothetical protein